MIFAPDLDTLSVVLAPDLKEGDQIVNVGTVEGHLNRIGVWVLVEVITSQIGLGTGHIHINQHQTLVLHEADSIVVVQTPE